MSEFGPVPSQLFGADGTPLAAAPPAPATPAATVVVLRDGRDGPEVLMLRRRRGGAFSGMWVFPGGKVEETDTADPSGDPEAARLAAGGFADLLGEVAVARLAAVREAAEEAGLALRPADLTVHSFWMPPPAAPRRFSTWFFVTGVPVDAVVVDDAEVREHRWLTPAAAFAGHDDGSVPLAAPTWMTLWQMAAHADTAAALAEAAGRPPVRFETHLGTTASGGAATMWAGDVAYDSGDLDAPGPRRRLWVTDGAPWRLEVTFDPAGTLTRGGPGGPARPRPDPAG